MKLTRQGIDFNPPGEHSDNLLYTWADFWCQTWHRFVRRAWLPGLANVFGGYGPERECAACHKQWGAIWR